MGRLFYFMKNIPYALDLHGIKHENVHSLVENFVLSHQENMPLEIIYGNSTTMRHLVIRCLDEIGACFGNGYKNQYGRLLVLGWKD